MKRELTIGLFSLVLISGAGCKKEEEAKKRYITSLKVINIPNNDEFDLLNGPDIRLDMAATGSGTWSYASNMIENVSSYPVSISFQSRFLVSDEDWDFQLVDEDLTSDEMVCFGTLNPYSEGKNGVIRITKNGEEVLHLNYEEE